MPWTVKDVDEHKKGLTAKQKRKWVSVANSTLKECQEKGNSNCDAKAIKAANGTVNNKNMETTLLKHSTLTTSYSIRTETFEQKQYLVVPVVMMVEGVHHGSHGPILHTAEELSKFTDSWNGRPVFIDHPEVGGLGVSGNSPDILENSVGRIFNTHIEDGKLKGEAWIDPQKLAATNPEALGYIRNGRPMDVSIGVFSDQEDASGEWNGEQYQSIAHNYRPDHLALLPGGEGACSWSDGCGIRNNNKKGGIMENLKKFKELGFTGYSLSLIGNEQGYAELLNAIRSKLDSMDNAMKTYFLQEVFDNRVVYAVHTDGGSTLYQQDYSVNDSNVVTLEGDPVEVRRKVDYVTMKMKRTKGTQVETNKKENNMACCEDRVDKLIANGKSTFDANDKEWLMNLNEDQLKKLEPVEEKTEAPQVNKDEVITEFKSGLKTVDDYTSIMPDEMKSQVESGVKLYKEKRKNTIKDILDNSKDVWNEADLNNMEDSMLDKIAKSVVPSDYSGQATFARTETNEDEVAPMEIVGRKKETK